jgi:hypothetical protein
MKALISLLTDFGVKDSFVAEMKAVIFSICPDANVIDITHEVERFNIRMGAFLLASAVPYFPAGTIHVAVVDPGVGGERRPVLVETARSLYVGPDNGLLIPAASRESIRHVYELTNRSLMREIVSSTFHGRDIFAPVAAHLASGTPPAEVGEEITDYVRAHSPESTFDRRGIQCEVLHVDNFGNIIINITEQQVKKLSSTRKHNVIFHRKRIPVRLVRTYADLRGKEFGLLLGSHGFLEIACREASAASRLRVRSGDVLRVDGA